MEFYRLEPEVAGVLEEGTVIDAATHPPRIESVHYEITDWSGDDLVEAFPVYLVTDDLADTLVDSGLDAFRIRRALVTVSEEAQELMEGKELPTFHWLDVTGQAGVDDIGATDQGQLVVSEQALALFRGGTLESCEVDPF